MHPQKTCKGLSGGINQNFGEYFQCLVSAQCSLCLVPAVFPVFRACSVPCVKCLHSVPCV
jgi:hypothetical protein